MSDETIFDEIGRFDPQFKPQAGFQPGIDTLADGNYEFAVVSAKLERTQQTGEPILKTVLRVLPAGATVEWAHFFSKQEQVNRLGADLEALGFPVGGKPFSAFLRDTLPKLGGLKFSACKRSRPKQNSTDKFHDLHVSARRPAQSGPPPAARPAPAPTPAAAPAKSEESIPF